MLKKYPNLPKDERPVKRDYDVISSFHNNDIYVPPGYPSHLHIDLVARAQGKGIGTKMILHLENELKKRGATAVHLEMALENNRAFQFYMKLGFQKLKHLEDVQILGKQFH